MNNHLPSDLISLSFLSYAAIPFKAHIDAEELCIDWGNGNTYENHTAQADTKLSYLFPAEGLQQITISGKNISYLEISGMCITDLRLLRCPHLEYLDCSGNEISLLDLSACPVLEELHCNSNNLTELYLRNHPALTELQASYNQLQRLILENCPGVHTLHCTHNRLEKIDVSGCPEICHINVSHNFLESGALDCLFQTLPVKEESDFATVRYFENPGFQECRGKLFRSKKWH